MKCYQPLAVYVDTNLLQPSVDYICINSGCYEIGGYAHTQSMTACVCGLCDAQQTSLLAIA